MPTTFPDEFIGHNINDDLRIKILTYKGFY